MTGDYMEAVMPLIEDTVGWAVKRYNVQASGVMGTEDLGQDLLVAALEKREKLQPRLEAGQVGYVVKALQNAARDALEPDWKRQQKDGGTLEDLEADLYGKKTPRMVVASKNPSPPPAKIQRAAAKAVERALERKQQERAAAVFLATLTDPTDVEIFKLYLGEWLSPGATVPAIARELRLSEQTVYRRLADIKKRLQNPRENAEPLNTGDGN